MLPVCLVLCAPLLGGPVVLELEASRLSVGGCEGNEVEIAFSVTNLERAEIAGFQAFLRFPTQLFEPVKYSKLDLGGFAGLNGPIPFGGGYPACDARPADPWDDGLGADTVSVAASAYGEGAGQRPVSASAAVLGAFLFRLRPGVGPTAGPAVFQLEFDSCSTILKQGNALYDSRGLSLPVAFSRPRLNVEIREGIRVRDLSCAEDPAGVALSWAPPSSAAFDGVNVYRDGVKILSLVPPSVRSIVDREAPRGKLVYEVVVILGGREESCRATCALDRLPPSRKFIRGDVNDDGRRNISDPVALLDHLFQGQTIACPDAADYDDNGRLDLSDAVNLLTYLFREGPPPAPPFPDPGEDPTEDDLGCGEN